MNWFLLNIKTNEEQQVANAFKEIGIQTFCPIILENVDNNTNIRQQIRSFIFVKLAKKYRGIVFGMPHVQGYFISEGKPALLTDADIQAIENGTIFHFKNLKINRNINHITT